MSFLRGRVYREIKGIGGCLCLERGWRKRSDIKRVDGRRGY